MSTTANQLPRIEHAQTKDGGFAAVDHHRQIAVYAYPTSSLAETYKSSKARNVVAAAALACAGELYCPDDIRLNHYQHIRDTCF